MSFGISDMSVAYAIIDFRPQKLRRMIFVLFLKLESLPSLQSQNFLQRLSFQVGLLCFGGSSVLGCILPVLFVTHAMYVDPVQRCYRLHQSQQVSKL
jgi:hypothetical protein